MYRRLNQHYREKFGCKVYKLSIDGGFSCPNRDGTCGWGGCIFCDGSGAFAERGDTISQQLEQAKRKVEAKNPGGKYIAYFQAFTNTYAPVEHLRKAYYEAIAGEEIVGLAIGPRPDCLEEDIEVVTHIILGLPGETVDDGLRTTADAVAAGTDGVKFHLLHVLRGTDLARDYEAGKFTCLSLEEYGGWLKACIDILPPHITVHRITGDGAKRDLIAPLWSGDKKRVLNYLNNLLK